MKHKIFLIGAVTLATLATPLAASAQSWRGDRDYDGRYERWEYRQDRRDWRRDQRYERQRYNDMRRHQRQEAREYRRWTHNAPRPYEHRSRW